MKKLFLSLILILSAALAAPAVGQSRPGWGWVNRLGTAAANTTTENKVAGLGRDAAGNLYLLGSYVGSPVFAGSTPTPNAGESDVYLVKYDARGTLLWLRTLQSTGTDLAAALVVEPNGRCTVAGTFGHGTGGDLSFASFGAATTLRGPRLLGLPAVAGKAGLYDALPYIATVDAAGSLVWADTPSATYGTKIISLHRDALGSCYISANAIAPITFSGLSYTQNGLGDAVLMKYNSAGQPVWGRVVGISGRYTYSSRVKTDAANNLYWNVNHDRALLVDGVAIAYVPPSNPVTAGSNSLIKISPANALIWAKNGLLKSGFTNAQAAVIHADISTNSLYILCGSYGGVISGESGSATVTIPAGSYGTCVARCDTSGAVQWIRPIGTASTVPGGAGWAAIGVNNFFPDASGFTVLTNTAFAAQTIFPNGNIFNSNRGGMPCVGRYSYATNQYDWLRTGGLSSAFNGSPLGSTAVASVVDSSGNVFVAGTFTGTAQFGNTTIASTTSTQPDVFLAMLDQSRVTSAATGNSATAWSVYPNPTTGTAHLRGLPAEARVRVFNALGQLVIELPAVRQSAEPRIVTGLSAGFYLLQVSCMEDKFPVRRLIVQ